jgi:hypothetical protein
MLRRKWCAASGSDKGSAYLLHLLGGSGYEERHYYLDLRPKGSGADIPGRVRVPTGYFRVQETCNAETFFVAMWFD